MQFNLEGANNGGSEQASSSDDGQFVVALRKMMKKEVEVIVVRTVQQVIGPIMEDFTLKMMTKEVEVIVVRTVQQVIGPIMEDLIRKVVKEEIRSAEDKFLAHVTGNHANEATKSRQRTLQLKFLDEISGPVLTGKAIEWKGGTLVRVALVDSTTGQVVNCGPESSEKVEILVLDASEDDNEHSSSVEEFNRRIIREGDKKKPHFAKSNYMYLEKGVGVLCNAKLGHDSNWMKSCKCRLGARILGNLGGVNVQNATTESFMVFDSRRRLYEKHHPPSLSDHVWRLENIGKNGPRCKRLKEKNIFTVQNFLFLLSIDPQRLQKIVSAGAKWKATVDHARTCVVDDERISLYYPSPDIKMGVAFDAVGGLKGLIDDSCYVPVNNLSADEKNRAQKLLLSAFENQNDIISFHDETTLLHQFPLRSSNVNAPTISSIEQEIYYSSDIIISENINGCDTPEPTTFSQSINPYNESATTGLLDDTYLGVPYQMLSPQFSNNDIDHLLQYESLPSLWFHEMNNFRDESNSRRQSRTNLIEVVAIVLRVVQASKRFMALGGLHVQKRQRT